jgi:F-type H+-transporting ATPase subunit b
LELLTYLSPLSLAQLEMLDWKILVSSAIGFLILLFVLKRFLFGPVLGVIDERRTSIEAAFQEVDDARTQVAAMRAELEARLAQINSESQARMQEAVDRGQQIANEIRQASEEQREKLLQRTQEDIERETAKALAELRNAAVDISYDMTRRVLRDNVDKAAHEKLVAGFVDDLKRLN